MDPLQAGDWVGQGAAAFYAEMNDQVLPTCRRLQAALKASADVTQKISQAMQAAEGDAAKVLRGAAGSASGAAGGAAGAVGSVAAGAAGAAAGVAAGAAGSAAGAAGAAVG